ncbi:glycosyltransferase [Bacillus sp. B15-48]|uniref:glycosyltransferase n=1 Tax=Bacillus sp. B15-48 TaxID=1548601 RepID=UPI0031B843D3
MGLKKIKSLDQPFNSHNNELISVIVAAKNEEEQIKASLLSQFAQTYKNIEWIVVNDRSTDQTGEIITELLLVEPRLQVIHIDELPSGWLGKNHALYKGFQEAKGEWLLFTDGDILYDKHAFKKAISYANQNEVDHLSVMPNITGNGFWLQAFISFFLFGFNYFKRPWVTNSANSKQSVSIGAFNLVKREAYVSIGTHKSLAMRPDDDLQLALRIKKAGFRQHLAEALNFVEVIWYNNLSEAIRGLEKNTFAGLHYRLSMVLFAIGGIFISQILPFWLLLFGTAAIRLYSLVAIVLIFITYYLVLKKETKFPLLTFAAFPITASLFLYTIIRATILTYIQGGIYWRGTFYSLNDLKKGNKND